MGIMVRMETIHQIVDRAKAANIPLPELCKRAGVALSTVNRWRSGANGATLNKMNALLHVIAEVEASKPSAGPSTTQTD